MSIKATVKKIDVRLIALLIFVIVLWFAHIFSGTILKPIAISQIENLTGTNVKIGNVKFRLSGKITLYDVEVAPETRLEPDNAILIAKKIDAYFSLNSLLVFKPRIKKLKIEDFTLNAQYNEDVKSWNLTAIKPNLGSKKTGIPKLRFKRGSLRYSQVSGGEVTDIIACNINASKFSAKTEGDKFIFSIHSDSDAGNKLSGEITTGEITAIEIKTSLPDFVMNLFGSDCEIKNFNAAMITDANGIVFKKAHLAIGDDTIINVDGNVSNLKNEPEFVFNVKIDDITLGYDPALNTFAHGSGIFEKFIPMLQVFFDNYNPQGLLDIEVVLSGKTSTIAKTKCDGYLGCKDITMQYKLFPYQLSNLAGRIDVTETSMNMKDLTAKHGDVDVVMNGHYKGRGKTMDCNIVMNSPNMKLNDSLFKALLPWQKQLWYLFSPTGEVSGDFVFIASPPDIREMNLYVDLNDVGITCQYFPYPITGASGKLKVEGNEFALQNIRCQKGNGSITLDGLITETSSPLPKYNFAITADDVPIDKDLIDAFPQTQREFFSQFDIESAIGSADIKINSVNDPNIKIDYSAQMNITAKSIGHDALQIPLTGANLKAKLTPIKIDIESFTADYNTSPVALSGTVWTGIDGMPFGYCLYTKAMGIHLTPQLAAIAKSDMANKTLEDFQFAGTVNIEAALSKDSRTDCPGFKISIDCLSDTAIIKKFNIPLRDVTGRITVDSNNIELINLAATPIIGPLIAPIPRIKLDGNTQLGTDGVNYAELEFAGANIEFSSSLIPMMGRLGGLYEKIAPTGQFDFTFKPVIFQVDTNGQKKLTLDGETVFKNCTLGKNKLVSNINILLDTKVEYQPGKGFKYAYFLLNATYLEVKNRPIENLKVPIYYDPNAQTITANNFYADCMGGKLKGKAVFKIDDLNKLTNYSIDSAFSNISTERLIDPQQPQTAQSTGHISGQLNIEGNIQKPEETIGRFIAKGQNIKSQNQNLPQQLSDAIYESSQKKFNFQKITLDSYIRGTTLQIGRLDIFGPTLALRGTGRFDIKKNDAEVKFTGFVNSGDNDEPGFLGSLAAGIAPALLKVDVTGSFDKPKINVTTLPILQESLKIIGVKE